MNATNQTESSYVRALQAHRPADFSMLYDAYSPALYGFLLRLVNDPTRAQHLLQDAFATIWSNSRQYDARQGRLFSWMLSITRTVAIESLSIGQAQTTPFLYDQPALAYGAEQPHPQYALPTLLTAPDRETGHGQKPVADSVKTRLRMGLQQLKTYFSAPIDQHLAGSRA